MSKKRRTIIKVSLPLTPLEIKLAELYRSVQRADSLITNDIQQYGYVPNPGRGLAAVLIIEEFQEMGYTPNILRFARVFGVTPPRFEAVEVVRLQQPRVEEADADSFGPTG